MLVPPQMGYRRPVNATRTSKVTAFPEKVEKVGRSAGGASKTWNFVAIPPPHPAPWCPDVHSLRHVLCHSLRHVS